MERDGSCISMIHGSRGGGFVEDVCLMMADWIVRCTPSRPLLSAGSEGRAWARGGMAHSEDKGVASAGGESNAVTLPPEVEPQSQLYLDPNPSPTRTSPNPPP
jgi:hypothetical protein